MNLAQLAERLGCELDGDGGIEITDVAGLEDARAGDVSFLANRRYLPRLASTAASAVIVAPDVHTPLPRLLSSNPYVTYAQAVALLHPSPAPSPGIHPSAQVDAGASIAPDAHVGALVVVGPRARVGPRCVLHPHVVLYADVVLEEDCVLHAGVQVREGCRLGRRVVVQNGAIIGADGFGFARDDQGHYVKIPQVGVVVIEDDVEIGALSAVDRAALRQTRIGRGTKIDNLVQVGHSVTIGSHSVLAGQVGVAGSTRIGNGVTLAGQVGVAGHLTIGDGVTATAQTGIPNSVEAGALVSGYPAITNRAWLKAAAIFPRLPELWRRLRRLERKLGATLGGPEEAGDD